MSFGFTSLTNFKQHELFNFIDFPELNGCVLDTDGFNVSNHKVNIILGGYRKLSLKMK